MGIPDFQAVMLPLLKFLSDGKEHSVREAIEYVSNFFKLDEEERRKLLLSGKQPIIDNRVGWARTYMKKAGLLDYPHRSYVKITQRGLEVLKKNPEKINIRFLEQFPGFIEFRTVKKDEKKDFQQADLSKQTPEEILQEGYEKIKGNLAQDILNLVKKCSPDFFEKLVIDLIIKMGYGGSRKDAGEQLGRSGDGGVDGMIKEDKLGLSKIYIQAKRWEGSVGRPEVQKFVGALQGRREIKGIFITTGTFSKEAIEYASGIGMKIILIDGDRLAQFMIEYNVGVSTEETYEIKKIDSDYFSEE